MENVGVDLNRNYDWAFGIDNVGSNGNPCEEDFRGRHAFSEPATKQIKTLIEKTPEGRQIKIALNLHSWGNLLIHPWSYLKKSYFTSEALTYSDQEFINHLSGFMCHVTKDSKVLFYAKPKSGACKSYQALIKSSEFKDIRLIDMKESFKFYQDIALNSGIPKGNKEGNGFSTVDYPANGEASDWMFGAHGILAMSPELGTKDKASEVFFIGTEKVLKETISANYPWMKYTMMKLVPSFNVKVSNLYERNRKSLNETILTISLSFTKNQAFS